MVARSPLLSEIGRIVRRARAMGGRTLWLAVWQRNPRAIAFYRKYGFRDVGTHFFVVGSDHQTDRVMFRELDGAEHAK